MLMNAKRPKPMDMQARRKRPLLLIPACKQCGEDAVFVTSTQGTVRYLKCAVCGKGDKISEGAADAPK
jgi:hypothetical protein